MLFKETVINIIERDCKTVNCNQIKYSKFKYYYYYKDLFTHKDINTYINGVVEICLNKFLNIYIYSFTKEKRKICKIMHK